MCMHNLESKDLACRKKGYKRYWVVTNVDKVAANIKHGVGKLAGQPVFTRDFTRMYTSIPQLVEAIQLAIAETFAWHASKTKEAQGEWRVKVSYKANRAEACFAKEGVTFAEVIHLLEAVCSEVYFQQQEGWQVLKQKQGLPMGGKASAELANLYCYAKESE